MKVWQTMLSGLVRRVKEGKDEEVRTGLDSEGQERAEK